MPLQMENVLSPEEIQKKIAVLAKQISADYGDKEVVAIGILKGAFIFLADLVRQLTNPVQVDFIRLSSYGSGTATSGRVRVTKELDIDIAGRHVLVVEDIVDTGLTIACLLGYLEQFKPASIKVCALIDKTERRTENVRIDYVGHTVKAGFLIGYGLDLDERYRALPGIYHLIT